MHKTRVLVFLTTVLVVGIVGTIAALYARGFRLNTDGEITSNGLLVVNSEPTGASVMIDGELQTASNATIPLPQGNYDVILKKEGFLAWSKRLTITPEVVTQIDVSLFASAPSLSAVTFAGSFSPNLSPDFTKIAYGVPATLENIDADKEGLWLLDTGNLPLGFNREPRRITDGDLSLATWQWSPDSRQILLTISNASFLLNTSEFTSQANRVNIANQKTKLLSDWEIESKQRLEAQLAKLPDEFQDILKNKATDVVFSPNENKILYTATASAHWQDDLIKQLPGSSTQKQSRDIKTNIKYIYDIKEDRNFEISTTDQPVYWFPTSHHIVIPEEGKISLMDYDGTNKQTVYAGSYVYPFAFATVANTRLIILTNFGAVESAGNLYSLGIK